MTAQVIPIRARAAKSGYAVGVKPFDPSNPAHINAWNAIHQLGWAEQAIKQGGA